MQSLGAIYICDSFSWLNPDSYNIVKYIILLLFETGLFVAFAGLKLTVVPAVLECAVILLVTLC